MSAGSRGERLEREPMHRLGWEDEGLALTNAVRLSSNLMGRVDLHDMPGHQTTEEHPDRGQVAGCITIHPKTFLCLKSLFYAWTK